MYKFEESLEDDNVDTELEQKPNIYPQTVKNNSKEKKTPTQFEVSPPKITNPDSNRSNSSKNMIVENLLDLSLKNEPNSSPPESKGTKLQQSSYSQKFSQPQAHIQNVFDLTDIDFGMGNLIETQSRSQQKNEREVIKLESKENSITKELTFGESSVLSRTKFEKDEKSNIAAVHQEPKDQTKDYQEKKRINKWNILKEQKSADNNDLFGNKGTTQDQFFGDFGDMISQTKSVVISQKEQYKLNNSREQLKLNSFHKGNEIQFSPQQIDDDDVVQEQNNYYPENLDEIEPIQEKLVQKYPKLDSCIKDQYRFNYQPTIIPQPKIEQNVDKVQIVQKTIQTIEQKEEKIVNEYSFKNEKGENDDEGWCEPNEEEHKLEEEVESDSITEIRNNFIPPRDNKFESHKRQETLDFARTAGTIATDEGFADEDTLYAIGSELMRLSKHMGTQTLKNELFKVHNAALPESFKISIIDSKPIKEGYFKTYTLYTIETVLKAEDNKTVTVHRRYNDFQFLFNYLEKKYKGHILPLLPEKNILTNIHQESLEFSESRKRGLVEFLNKCMQHPFFRATDELEMFLTDDKGYQNFVQKEQEAEAAKQGYGIMNILSKAANVVTKVTERKPIFRQMTQVDNDLSNYEQYFASLVQRLKAYNEHVIRFIQIKKQNTNNMVSFIRKFQDIQNKSVVGKSQNVKIIFSESPKFNAEDIFISNLKDLSETQLKTIIASVEAINRALENRNNFIQELYDLGCTIEEKNLQAKKKQTNNTQLPELQKQYDSLKENFQGHSETLLSEVEEQKRKIEDDLIKFTMSLQDNHTRCLIEAQEFWGVQSELVKKRN